MKIYYFRLRKTKKFFSSREFQRMNDECADKIYDIRERSDLSREWLLNSDGVAPRFYQLEADAVSFLFQTKQKILSSIFVF
jgi:hypothetical protein